jgi:Nif-specific regulatory protein
MGEAAAGASGSEYERLRQERDLYLGLLGLTDRDQPGQFLDGALDLIVGVLGADQGYLEVFDPNAEGPTWWRSAGFSENQVEIVRSIVSRGIIQEAVALGEAIVCPSAIIDPRFSKRPSVQASRIEAVLCVPIMQRTPIGVLYVQGRRSGGSFAEFEVERAQTFAKHLAPLVEGLIIRTKRRTDEVAPYRSRLKMDGVVGTSAAMAKVLHEIELYAPVDVTVLITGEMGTGKTLMARMLHENGPRKARPFLELNCATLQETLFEAELFGSVPGAYTGAVRREGMIAAARGGTLLLDEVGEIPMASQAKLLQVLQSKQYFAVGSAVPMTADVRIVAATNSDLEDRLDRGERAERGDRGFRSDLYYRLKVLSFRMPSLSERAEDIPLIAEAARVTAQRNLSLPDLPLSPGALRAIEAAEWPGNIRQLENAIQAAAIRATGERAQSIEATHVFGKESTDAPRGPLTFQAETRRFQARLLQRALEATDWNVTAAAKSLDLTRAHVHNLIKAFGLSRKGGE